MKMSTRYINWKTWYTYRSLRRLRSAACENANQLRSTELPHRELHPGHYCTLSSGSPPRGTTSTLHSRRPIISYRTKSSDTSGPYREGPMSSAQTFAPDRFRSKSKLGYFCLWVNAAQTTLFAPQKTSIFSPNSLGIPYRKLSLGGPFCNGPKTLEISKTADNKNIPI